MKIVEDFDEKSYNNNGKPWKSSTILRVNPNFFNFLHFLHVSSFSFILIRFFFIFSFFPFFPFFHFSHFFIFSFFHFVLSSFFFKKKFIFLSCSIMFYHVLSFSFIFFHFLSFSFILLGAQNLIFFRASISLRFLLIVLI